MSGRVIELRPVTHITTGAVGPPGQRVFYLQAVKDDQRVTAIVEKQHVLALAVGVEQLVRDLQERLPNLPPASDAYVEGDMQLQEPLDPLFRAGQIGLGYDDEADLLVLMIAELQVEDAAPDEAPTTRLWATRSQMRALARHGLEIAQRGRPVCSLCGQPIDPDGHLCPRRNGHKH